jgi:pimeloyl-ACP methyl ester carboxylesterase
VSVPALLVLANSLDGGVSFSYAQPEKVQDLKKSGMSVEEIQMTWTPKVIKKPWINSTHQLSLQEGDLEVCCYGPEPASEPTLVLLHEGLGCLARWRDFPGRLANETGIGVLAYSRFGYGRSNLCALPRPLDFMTQEAVEVLPELLAAYGIQNYSLAGHSDGGSIATIHASRAKNPDKLILLAPHFFVEQCCVDAITKARVLFEREDLADRLGKYHNDVDTAFRGWCDVWLDPDFISGWNIEEDIKSIHCPVLTIQGDQDIYGTMAQYRSWKEHSNFHQVTMVGCGHDPVAERTEETLAVMIDFLQD